MTADLIRPHELVEVARELAAAAAVGPGQPRAAQLRRAVSTAYYALFHELVTQATTELCGADPGSDAERRQVSRWVAHTDLRVLAEATTRTAGGGVARAVAPVLGSPHQDLEYIAETFVRLQKERHRADYDHDYQLDRSAAGFLIDDAEDAIERARRLDRSGDRSYRRFLKLMVGAVRIARTRAP